MSRSINRRRVRRASGMGRIVLTVAIVLVIAAVITLINPFSRMKVSASTESIDYVSYVVQSGDNLWNIAEENKGEIFDNCNDYIEEVMRANNLKSTDLHVGQLLMIPVEDKEVVLASSEI